MDPRLTLARDGVAALALEGIVPARAYRATRPMRLILPYSPMRDAPSFLERATSELLFGETFEVLLEDDGFAFGQNRRDGYVGFVALSELTEAEAAPTHRVCVQYAPVFRGPDIKAPDPMILARNSLVRVMAHEGKFAQVKDEGFIPDLCLAPLGVYERDPAAVALDYLHTPYIWGGRSSEGLDCSGLVQMALTACGRFCPRDSDMQRDAFAPVSEEDLKRGDLVFWPGHVAMLTEGETMVHATAFHMRTAVEPLAEAIARIGTPSAYRRP